MASTLAVLDDFTALAAAGSVELVSPGGEAVACAVDEATVHRAIANLVDNAVKHAPPGSAVDVAVERRGAWAEVTVTDHGPGIPEADRADVFERFWRGGGSPGTGLGLPIARQIAQAHGGTLSVDTPGPAGDGCRFRLGLPVGPV